MRDWISPMHSLSFARTSFAFSSKGLMFSGVIASFASLSAGADADAANCGGTERTDPAFVAAPFVGECGSSSSSSTLDNRIARGPRLALPSGDPGTGSAARRDDADALNERREIRAWRNEYPAPCALGGAGTGSGSGAGGGSNASCARYGLRPALAPRTVATARARAAVSRSDAESMRSQSSSLALLASSPVPLLCARASLSSCGASACCNGDATRSAADALGARCFVPMRKIDASDGRRGDGLGGTNVACGVSEAGGGGSSRDARTVSGPELVRAVRRVVGRRGCG